MKKVIGILVIAFLFVGSLNANTPELEKTVNEEVFIDCYATAQAYYIHLRDNEGVENREAGRRARVFYEYCQSAQQ